MDGRLGRRRQSVSLLQESATIVYREQVPRDPWVVGLSPAQTKQPVSQVAVREQENQTQAVPVLSSCMYTWHWQTSFWTQGQSKTKVMHLKLLPVAVISGLYHYAFTTSLLTTKKHCLTEHFSPRDNITQLCHLVGRLGTCQYLYWVKCRYLFRRLFTVIIPTCLFFTHLFLWHTE